MSLSPPVKITVPFATGGLKNAIPANANPTDGHAGYDVGFPAINMTPKIAGGIPPFGQDFNGIFFEVSTAIQFLEAGGSFPFDSAFATAVGGYPIGAVVSRTDSTGLWRNTVANNTTNPETFGAGWQPEDAGLTSITMTNANVTLTALQAARSIIVISGALTASVQLAMPAYTKQWSIVNNCTGAFTVLVKTPAGSGVIINTGTTQIVLGDGTNIANASIPVVGVIGTASGVRMYVSAASASATISAASAIAGQSQGGNKYLLSGVTVGCNLATTGAGGMDTGAAPNNGYIAIYLIYNPSSGAINSLAVNATSVAAPDVYGGANLPSGFTASVLMTVVPTNGSGQFRICIVKGRAVGIVSSTAFATSTAVTNTVVAIASIVPLNAVEVSGTFSLSASTASNLGLALVSDTGQICQQNLSLSNMVSGQSIISTYSGILLSTAQQLIATSTVTAGTPAISAAISEYRI